MLPRLPVSNQKAELQEFARVVVSFISLLTMSLPNEAFLIPVNEPNDEPQTTRELKRRISDPYQDPTDMEASVHAMSHSVGLPRLE